LREANVAPLAWCESAISPGKDRLENMNPTVLLVQRSKKASTKDLVFLIGM